MLSSEETPLHDALERWLAAVQVGLTSISHRCHRANQSSQTSTPQHRLPEPSLGTIRGAVVLQLLPEGASAMYSVVPQVRLLLTPCPALPSPLLALQGRSGALPNLDLVNVMVSALPSPRVGYSPSPFALRLREGLASALSLFMPRASAQPLARRSVDLWRFASALAVGPWAPHSPLLAAGYDAVTLTALPAPSSRGNVLGFVIDWGVIDVMDVMVDVIVLGWCMMILYC